MSWKSIVIAIVIVLLAFSIVIAQIEDSDDPYDPYFDKQWALSNNDTDIDIDAKSMWKSCINTTSKEATRFYGQSGRRLYSKTLWLYFHVNGA